MKKLIIAEEEKKRILKLYSLIKEQESKYVEDFPYEEGKYSGKLENGKPESGLTGVFVNKNGVKTKWNFNDDGMPIDRNKITIPWDEIHNLKNSEEAKKFFDEKLGWLYSYPAPTQLDDDIWPKETKTEENIVTNFDRMYDYKKDGDKYYYRLKSNPDTWIEATNPSGKSAIATLVFKEKTGCEFPQETDACKDWDAGNWQDNPDLISEKVTIDTNIGFCSKHYCTVKYIQESINLLIDDDKTIGHTKLKEYPKLEVDGKFGKTTQNHIYALLGKVSTTVKEITDQFKTV